MGKKGVICNTVTVTVTVTVVNAFTKTYTAVLTQCF